MTESTLPVGASFADALAHAAQLTDQVLGRLLVMPQGPEARVVAAMRYSALAPGKRLRPLIVLASSRLFAVARSSAL